MGTHDGLITIDDFHEARKRVRAFIEAEDLEATEEKMAGLEPSLVHMFDEACHTLSGRLSLAGAPPEVVVQNYTEVMELGLVLIATLRRAYRNFWESVDGPATTLQLHTAGEKPEAVAGFVAQLLEKDQETATEIVQRTPIVLLENLAPQKATQFRLEIEKLGGTALCIS